ncbi:MAG: hypothetical protein GY834_05905 [Bacteroidetes bacterium]|nr:hypothetical protein [Bacteroidota bacterium]
MPDDVTQSYGNVENVLQLNTSSVEPHIVKAIQEQQKVIEAQQSEIEAQQTEIEALKAKVNEMDVLKAEIENIKSMLETRAGLANDK